MPTGVAREKRSTKEMWKDEELIVAVFLYRFGWEDLGVTYTDLGRLMHRNPSTIIFRLSNFLSFDGVETGLGNGGKHAQEVYESYRHMPREELRRKAIQSLLWLAQQT